MSPTIQVLTPLAAGAIATLRLRGVTVWDLARTAARLLNGQSLPELPVLHRTYLVRWCGDEIILAVRQLNPLQVLELHTHGGVKIVRDIVASIVEQGAVEWSGPLAEEPLDPRALPSLSQAKTLRTASILLDQHHGAFRSAVQSILDHLAADQLALATTQLEELGYWSDIGTRLVTGWKLVIAGAPNAGKSSLLNRLAGYDRAVVSPIAGTTRDVVTSSLALDGWPVEVADTAGIRLAQESLEAEGIRRARQRLSAADLVVWLLDATATTPARPGPEERSRSDQPWLVAWNKCDDQPDPPSAEPTDLKLSARTGQGIGELVGLILKTWIPRTPSPGQAIPFTIPLASLCAESLQLLRAGKVVAAAELLRTGLSGS